MSDFIIAVFTPTLRQFNELNLRPKNKFKYIRNINDIRGIRFKGVIEACYYSSSLFTLEQDKAMEELKYFQPELFKTN